MEHKNFLTINHHSLSLAQSLAYLRATGKLQPFIIETAKQYLLEQEVQGIEDIDIDTVEQLIINFRLQRQLANPEKFQQWLTVNSISFAEFRSQFTFRLKVDKLKAKIAEPKVEEYFAKRQTLLDRLVLSRLVVDTPELAQKLKKHIEAKIADFAPLTKQYSVVDDAIVGGVMGAIARGQMPEIIRDATENAQPGQIIGPLQIDDRFCLLKVETILSATLEGQLKQELENQIFEEWLLEKLQSMKIQLDPSLLVEKG